MSAATVAALELRRELAAAQAAFRGARSALLVVDTWLEELLDDLDAAEETAEEVRDLREMIAPHLDAPSDRTDTSLVELLADADEVPHG